MHRIRLGTLSLQSKSAPFPSTVSLFSVRFSPGSISAERLKQALDIGRVKRRGGIAAGLVDPRGQRLFALLQFEHALFDRTLRHELVDEDRLVLADAVGAVGRLVLDRRVPPGIIMNDGVGGGQIEAGAAGRPRRAAAASPLGVRAWRWR